MARRPIQPYEQPAVEPEIIPPDHHGSAWDSRTAPPGGFFGLRYGERVYSARVSPLGLGLFAALAVLLVIAVVVLLISALIVWIPILALLVFGGVIANWLRRHFVRPPV
jgi:hypothetical protein